MNTITIIKYNTQHYKQMIALRYSILRKPLNLEFTIQELENDKNDILIACFDNDEIIGCIILKKMPHNIFKFRQMAVAATHQNKGIGKKIISFAETVAIENKIVNIELNARETAIEFYKKMNYSIIGNVFFEVGIQHFRMEKLLEALNSKL